MTSTFFNNSWINGVKLSDSEVSEVWCYPLPVEWRWQSCWLQSSWAVYQGDLDLSQERYDCIIPYTHRIHEEVFRCHESDEFFETIRMSSSPRNTQVNWYSDNGLIWEHYIDCILSRYRWCNYGKIFSISVAQWICITSFTVITRSSQSTSRGSWIPTSNAPFFSKLRSAQLWYDNMAVLLFHSCP